MPKIAVTFVEKPYPTFPLFAHKKGSWVKKIGGAQIAFGPTRPMSDAEGYRQSWQDALKAYNDYMESRARGEALEADPLSATVTDTVNVYLTEKHGQAERKEIDIRTFAEMRKALTLYARELGVDRTLRQLEADPAPIHKYLTLMRSRYGFHAYNRNMRYVCAMWNWTGSPMNGALGRPFKWVELHKVRPVKEIRRQKRLERSEGARNSFSPAEIQAMVANASTFTRALLLLGYFAAYGNTDLAELPDNALTVYEKPEAIYFHGKRDEIPVGWGLLHFPRPKTEITRLAIVPPIVVEAIEAVRALDRPKSKETKHLMFRTANGTAIVTEKRNDCEAGMIDRVNVTDNVGAAFDRVFEKLGTCPVHGIVSRKRFTRGKKMYCPTCEDQEITAIADGSFYLLRHTATTIASSSGASSDTRNLFEGHATGKVRDAFYLDPTQMHDLLLITRELLTRFNAQTFNVQQTEAPAGAPTPTPDSASAA